MQSLIRLTALTIAAVSAQAAIAGSTPPPPPPPPQSLKFNELVADGWFDFATSGLELDRAQGYARQATVSVAGDCKGLAAAKLGDTCYSTALEGMFTHWRYYKAVLSN